MEARDRLIRPLLMTPFWLTYIRTPKNVLLSPNHLFAIPSSELNSASIPLFIFYLDAVVTNMNFFKFIIG